MVEIIAKYTSGLDAVTHALKLVVSFIMHTNSTITLQLAKRHTPNILPKNNLSFSGRPIVVFDIDDTLIFDVPNKTTLTPHKHVIDLFQRLQELGTDIHLVTARLNDRQMRKETEKELFLYNLRYDSLTLAPQRARTSMTSVSKWKMETRKKIGLRYSSPICLTVGDQWGDMIVLEEDDHIDTLDEEHSSPYILLRPNDGVSLWGLKLPSLK